MGYLKIITAILLWSSLGIFVRKAGLPLVSVVFYPSLFAGLFQSALLLKRKGFSLSAFKTSAPMFYILGPCSLANTLLYFYAFTHTTIANAVLTHYTAPIFVALTAPLFLKEKTVKSTWLAIVISSIGLWFILGWLSIRSEDFKGVIAGASSGLAYAIIILLLRTFSRTHSPLFIVLVQNVIITILLLPFITKTFIPVSSLYYLVIMGFVHSTLAPLLYVQGFKDVKANEAAILGYFEPVGAIILALIFLKEIPGLKVVLGGLLILYSGFMIVKKKGIK